MNILAEQDTRTQGQATVYVLLGPLSHRILPHAHHSLLSSHRLVDGTNQDKGYGFP